MGLMDELKRLFGRGTPDQRGNGGPDEGAVSCEEALEKLFEYLDGELAGVEEERVARHFEICRRCYPRLRFERSFQQAVSTVQSGEVPPPHLKRRIAEIVESEAGEGG